jgi:hypothetical protein
LGTQLDLLTLADVHAVFVYVFSFPCMRAGEGPKDLDMMCFLLVKSLPDCDGRLKAMPPWVPKESFHRVPTTSGVWHSQRVFHCIHFHAKDCFIIHVIFA